jgi:hypothetical protein
MKIEISDLQKLLEAIDNKKLSISEAIALINGKIEEPATTSHVISTDDIKLAVDYSKTVEQTIADGKYDWKNSDITVKNFPISPEMIGKKVDIAGRLFHFDRNISSEDAIKEMDDDGCRPATLMELLALGAIHPELQREFPIIALGSVWHDSDDYRHVPSLYVFGRDRGLYLNDFDDAWNAQCRFFGVRK